MTPGKITPSGEDQDPALGLILFSEDGLTSHAYVNGGDGLSNYDTTVGSLATQRLPGDGLPMGVDLVAHTSNVDESLVQFRESFLARRNRFYQMRFNSQANPIQEERPSAANYALSAIDEWSNSGSPDALSPSDLYVDPATRQAAVRAYELIHGDLASSDSESDKLFKGITALMNRQLLVPNSQLSSSQNSVTPNVNLISGDFFINETDITLPDRFHFRRSKLSFQ